MIKTCSKIVFNLFYSPFNLNDISNIVKANQSIKKHTCNRRYNTLRCIVKIIRYSFVLVNLAKR